MEESGRGVTDRARVETTPGLVRISCIIPTLNRERVLIDTLEMLHSQTNPAHEIIVVDQSESHDAQTAQVLENMRTEGTILLLRERQPNASRARNQGALAASGDILVFLDDDVVIKADFLQAYQDAFNSLEVDAVAGQILEGDEKMAESLPKNARDPEIGWLYFAKNYSRRCKTSWMASGNFGIRRETFLRVRGMDENYLRGAYREESDFAMRYKEAGGEFLFEPSASLYHLGALGAPEGGSRSWIQNKRIAGWHHCAGDWYFTIRFVNARNWRHLLVGSLRHFVFNRYNLRRPWLLPFLFIRWLAALPVAAYRRFRGPKLISNPEHVW